MLGRAEYHLVADLMVLAAIGIAFMGHLDWAILVAIVAEYFADKTSKRRKPGNKSGAHVAPPTPPVP